VVYSDVAKPWPLRVIGDEVNAVKFGDSPLGLVLSDEAKWMSE
jgi:hypothetical protein